MERAQKHSVLGRSRCVCVCLCLCVFFFCLVKTMFARDTSKGSGSEARGEGRERCIFIGTSAKQPVAQRAGGILCIPDRPDSSCGGGCRYFNSGSDGRRCLAGGVFEKSAKTVKCLFCLIVFGINVLHCILSKYIRQPKGGFLQRCTFGGFRLAFCMVWRKRCTPASLSKSPVRRAGGRVW